MLIPIEYPFTLRVRVRVRIFTHYVWRIRVQRDRRICQQAVNALPLPYPLPSLSRNQDADSLELHIVQLISEFWKGAIAEHQQSAHLYVFSLVSSCQF
jgi:hypothetical protein